MHQSIPAVPMPPWANPRAIAYFFKKRENSPGWRHISCLNAPGWDEERGQMPRPPDRRLRALLGFFINQ